MILEALRRFAYAEGLMVDPDFEMKPVAWIVRVDHGGRLLGIEGTHALPPVEGKRKPKLQAKPRRVPRQPIRTSGDLAFFLCDKAEYVFGLDPGTDAKKQRSAAKLAARFALFREQVRRCAEATGDAGVGVVNALLEAVASGTQRIRLPESCAPNDLFAFVYAPDGDELVHERPAVREYWKGLRSIDAGEPDGARCMITGNAVSEFENVPQIKRVPGKNTAKGISLVSFNSPAFESHGWRGNANAPISRSVAEAVATALNRLVDPAPADPRPETLGQTLRRRNLRLGDDTVVCFWASDQRAAEFLDSFEGLFGSDPEQVAELYRSIWRGRRVQLADPCRFYALTITGTQGRAIIRDWFESSVQDVAESLCQYFDDLEIARLAELRAGDPSESAPLPLAVLLASLAPPTRRGRSAAPLEVQFLHAALQRGARYPVAVLQRAVERARAEVGRMADDPVRWDARVALIKAVLRRNTQHQELTPTMDQTNLQPGYRLGRLLAVLEHLQQTASNERDVNATVVDRFFGAASATPQAVFPRLLKNARHHVRKAVDGPRARTANWLDRLIDEILEPLAIQAHRQGLPYTGFPTYLSLEQQGLFVLGYHHQRHWIRCSKEERKA